MIEIPSLDVAINALRAEAGAKKFDKSVKKIQRGAAGVDRSIAANDKSMNRFGGTLGKVAVGMFGMAAAYKGMRFAQSSLKEFAAFEQQLANVSTMLENQTMHYLPGYKDAIRGLAIEFGQSTETLSKGLYDILSASVGAADAIGVLKTASKAAIGGLTTTAIAADAITTVMNSYGMEAKDAGKISDILFATVKGGKITFGELAGSIGKVVSIAATAGLDLEQVSAAIATMTRNGIKSDMAMTSLKAIITGFIKPTDEAILVADKFNLTLNANTLQTIGLTGAMELLATATAEETAAIFPNIRALLGVAATRKNIVAMIGDHTKALDSDGAANEAYAKNADTLTTSLNRNKEEWKQLKGVIGEGIAPQLENWLSGFSKFQTEWITGWNVITQTQSDALKKMKKEIEDQQGTWLKWLPGFKQVQNSIQSIDSDTDAFARQMVEADEVIKRLTESTTDSAIGFNKLNEAMNDLGGAKNKPFDVDAGMPVAVTASVSPAATDEEKVTAAERAEAYRRMYDDMDGRNEESYRNRKELLELEKTEYARFIDDKVILEEWFKQRKTELDLERDIAGEDFQVGFAASIEQMKADTMSLGEIGAQSAQVMKSSFGTAVKSMIMNGATLKEAMHGFAMSMLSSFIDVITQMIAMKIMASAFGVGGAPTGGGFVGPPAPSAKGNVFTAGVKAFRNGGLIGQPTLFPMANGGVGLAGEAGTEAIMPLGRDGQGRLGVRGSGEGESKTPLKIVNVVDDSMIEEYLNSGSGERVVLNIMNRNREGGSESFV